MLSLTNPPNRPDILKYGWPNSTGNLGVRPGSAKIVWLNDVRHQAGFGCLKQIFQDVMLARLCSGSLLFSHNCVWLGLDVKFLTENNTPSFFVNSGLSQIRKKGVLAYFFTKSVQVTLQLK